MSELKKFINQTAHKEHLSFDESSRAFQIIASGGATPAQIAAFLMGLKLNSESIDEISGAAHTMRHKMKKLPLSPDLQDKIIDVCGTGGDGKNTYNISTTVAFVLAGCGVPVAKHGNRAVSSKSGSSDVLTALGININASKELMARALEEANICFLMATNFHPAMRFVVDVRRELGIRTIFNLLGPLINPAEPKMQLMGVYDKSLTEPIAHTLKNLGAKSAWVVHGEDGVDEISLCGKTYISQLKDGEISNFTINPQDYGFEILDDIKPLIGGDSDINAQGLRNVLSGVKTPYRDVVLLNAAAGLVIVGKTKYFNEAIELAKKSIDSGAAKTVLKKLVEISNSEIIV